MTTPTTHEPNNLPNPEAEDMFDGGSLTFPIRYLSETDTSPWGISGSVSYDPEVEAIITLHGDNLYTNERVTLQFDRHVLNQIFSKSQEVWLRGQEVFEEDE